MYFIELLVKHFQKKQEQTENYDPMKEVKEENDECKEHVFMPLDSTGETLACRNCGLVVKKNELKDINFFRKH